MSILCCACYSLQSSLNSTLSCISGREFPYLNPRAAFDAVDVKKRGELDEEDVAQLMREMDRDYSDIEVEMMMQTLDLNHNGRVGFDEFTKVFIGDIRTTQSM